MVKELRGLWEGGGIEQESAVVIYLSGISRVFNISPFFFLGGREPSSLQALRVNISKGECSYSQLNTVLL